MYSAAQLAPALSIELPAANWLILIAAISSACIVVIALAGLRRAHTTVSPLAPSDTSKLVTSGIYSISRNPIYLAFLLILTAWSVYLSNAAGFLFLPVFVVYLNRFQIVPEEVILCGKFGSEYTRYKREVRRWL